MNPILARFQDEPSLVSPAMSGIFEACVMAALPIMEKLEAQKDEEDEFWFSDDDWRSTYRPYKVKGGTLMIPIEGVLLNRFGWAIGYATGYEYIRAAMRRGMDDEKVERIVLNVNSPGGLVSGNFDLSDEMFGMRGRKPILAVANDAAYSAAYSLASAADRIAVTRSGGVGSIGVVTMHADFSKALEKNGVKVTMIYAGKHKVDGNPYEPLSEDVRKRMQERIETLYSDFVSIVARNRDMDEKKVRATEAATFMGSEATENGLADEVASFEDAIIAFTAKVNRNEEDSDMADKAQITEEALAAAVSAARAEGVKEGETAAKTRITAIIESDEGKKRPKAAMAAAMKTNMTADEATAFLGTLAEEPKEAPAAAAAPAPAAGVGAELFKAAMNGTQNPNVSADAPASDPAKSKTEERSALIKAFGLPGFKS